MKVSDLSRRRPAAANYSIEVTHSSRIFDHD
jgi:hypothetical protein